MSCKTRHDDLVPCTSDKKAGHALIKKRSAGKLVRHGVQNKAPAVDTGSRRAQTRKTCRLHHSYDQCCLSHFNSDCVGDKYIYLKIIKFSVSLRKLQTKDEISGEYGESGRTSEMHMSFVWSEVQYEL